MEEVELTSKQIRRARNRAALKERKEAAGDSVIPKAAEVRESKTPVQPNVEKTAVTAVRVPSVPKTKVKVKKLREQPDSDDGDLIAEVETPLDLDSVMDADFMAEIAALARECAANNPFDLEESESEDSVEEEVKPSKKSAITSKVLSTTEKTSQLSNGRAEKIKKNEAASSAAVGPMEESSKQSRKEDQVVTNVGKTSEKDKNSSWNFEVDYNDHFETPMVAYSDIVPMLKELAKSLGKSPKDLIIYDPYYCQGAMVDMLAELGFSKVRTYLISVRYNPFSYFCSFFCPLCPTVFCHIHDPVLSCHSTYPALK